MSKLKYYDGTNWKVVNGQITGDTLPIGAIIPYGSATAPTNWLVCDGSAVSRTTYAELFAVIGTSFGAGDGSTTFNLPNFKGKHPIGQDTNDTDFDTIGETGGSKTHTQTADEVAPHTHKLWVESDQSGSAYGLSQTSMYWEKATNNWANGQFGINRTDVNTAQPMDIMNPYQVVCYIIKAKQSAGLVANVSNTQSDSTTDTYSCDYINGIIESGSNANGEYVKYADGTMICTGVKYGNTTWEDWWGFCKRSPEGSNMLFASFPQAFVNGNARVSITTSHGNAVFSASYNSVQTDGFYFICYKPSSNTSTNYGIQYIAIGRWK